MDKHFPTPEEMRRANLKVNVGLGVLFVALVCVGMLAA